MSESSSHHFWSRQALVLLLAAACAPQPTPISIPTAPDARSILVLIDPPASGVPGAPDVFAGELSSDRGPSSNASLPISLRYDPAVGLAIAVVEYRDALVDLGLSHGPLPPATGDKACRPLPEFEFGATMRLGSQSTPWAPLSADAEIVGRVRLPCLTCPSGHHDGGGGICVATSTCTHGHHDGGDGKCLPIPSCAPGYKDNGHGLCVGAQAPCADSFHDDGHGGCAPIGSCASGYRDGGDGTCVLLPACSAGYHDRGDGRCSNEAGCLDTHHDGGDGECVPRGRCSLTFSPDPIGICYRFRVVGLREPRVWHTATLLRDGKVLVAGGRHGDQTRRSVEIFDPGTEQWSSGPDLTYARTNHAAAPLSSGGAIIAGGYIGDSAVYRAEVLETLEGGWTVLDRGGPDSNTLAAAPLPNGDAIFAGGQGGSPCCVTYSATFIFDAARRAWRSAPPLASARSFISAIALRDGRVLVSGGFGEPPGSSSGDGVPLERQIEVYDPGRGAWSSYPAGIVRANHAYVLLANGLVLLTAGAEILGHRRGELVRSTELFDPSTGLVSSGGDVLALRMLHTATVLLDGRVLVVGGVGQDRTALSTAEIYDPIEHRWAALPAGLHEARFAHTATRLPNGKVLIIGGVITDADGAPAIGTVELYEAGR